MKKRHTNATEESKKANKKAIRQKNIARAELTEAEISLAEIVVELCRKHEEVEKKKKRLELCWKEVHKTDLIYCDADLPE